MLGERKCKRYSQAQSELEGFWRELVCWIPEGLRRRTRGHRGRVAQARGVMRSLLRFRLEQEHQAWETPRLPADWKGAYYSCLQVPGTTGLTVTSCDASNAPVPRAHSDPASKALRLPSRAVPDGAGEPLGAAHASASHHREVTAPAGVSSASAREALQPAASAGGPPGCPLPRRAAGKGARGTAWLATATGSRAARQSGHDSLWSDDDRPPQPGTARTALCRFPVSLCARRGCPGSGARWRRTATWVFPLLLPCALRWGRGGLPAHCFSRSLPAARVGGVWDHGLHHRLRVGEVGVAAAGPGPLTAAAAGGWRRLCRVRPGPLLPRGAGPPRSGRLGRYPVAPGASSRLCRRYRRVSGGGSGRNWWVGWEDLVNLFLNLVKGLV